MAKPRPVSATVVSQIDKLFSPSTIRIRAEQPLTILNDDTRTHNVRVFDPRFDYNSGAQEPNESISIRFPVRGTFEAFCSIHPTMRLTVMVE
jgi:cytochrome c peroxidase